MYRTDQESLVFAANELSRTFLRVEREDSVLVVFDTTGDEIADAFHTCLEQSGIEVCCRKVPYSRQLKGAVGARLRGCLRESSVVVTALTSADECTAFRMSLLMAAKQQNARVLHMPGVLSKADFSRYALEAPWGQIDGVAQRIVRSLENVKRIDIVTISPEDVKRERTLTLECDGRPVFVVGADAQPGVVSNFPPGEVFLAPLEKKAKGTLILDGSAQQCKFREGDQVVLEFLDGALCLERSVFTITDASMRFRESLERATSLNPCALALCEFGIGLNGSIERLTGENVVDEKALGTAHIALGGNEPIGGQIECGYNNDLIFFPKSVLLDGQEMDHKWKKKGELLGG